MDQGQRDERRFNRLNIEIEGNLTPVTVTYDYNDPASEIEYNQWRGVYYKYCEITTKDIRKSTIYDELINVTYNGTGDTVTTSITFNLFDTDIEKAISIDFKIIDIIATGIEVILNTKPKIISKYKVLLNGYHSFDSLITIIQKIHPSSPSEIRDNQMIERVITEIKNRHVKRVPYMD